MDRRRFVLSALTLAALLWTACGSDPDPFAPLHPDAPPSTLSAFEAAVAAILFDLDTELLEVTSPLTAGATAGSGLGQIQSRIPLILPGIPPVFQRALERIARLAPPPEWARDHARFVIEHRDLLQKRIRLLGALNANRGDIAARLAVEIEQRFARLKAELDPAFTDLLAAFYDGRRYGGGLGS